MLPHDGLQIRIISMPGSERLADTRAAWEALFADVTVFPAVVGREVADDDPRISCGLYRRKKLRTWRMPWTIGTTAIHMTNAAQIGCALSHIAVWQEVARGTSAIVVEDDCRPTVSSPTRITRECNADFVSLMQRGGKAGLLRDRLSEFWGTQAYFVTPVGARLLLRHAFPLDMHVDRFIASVAHRAHAEWRIAHVPYKEVGRSSLEHITVHQVMWLSGFASVIVAIMVALLVAAIVCYRRLRRCRTDMSN